MADARSGFDGEARPGPLPAPTRRRASIRVILAHLGEPTTPLRLAPHAFRSSVHDAVIVGLEFDSDHDGVPDGGDFCPATTLPERLSTVELRGNRFALVDGDLLFDTAGKSLTLFDTAGCSRSLRRPNVASPNCNRSVIDPCHFHFISRLLPCDEYPPRRQTLRPNLESMK